MDDATLSQRVLASAAKYLIEGGEFDAANVLLSCSAELRLWEGGGGRWDDSYLALFTGPRAAYEMLRDSGHPVHQSIKDALAAVMPHGATVYGLEVKAEQIEPLTSEQLDEFRRIARGQIIHRPAPPRRVHWRRRVPRTRG